MKTEDIQIVRLEISSYDEIISIWDKSGITAHCGWRDTRDEIKRQINSGVVTFFGAKVAGALVGVVLCSDDMRRGWINHLAVIPEYRKQGIAQLLIEESEKYFESKKLKVITALVEGTNIPSQKLFEKTGYLELFPGLKYYSKRSERKS
jgi:N-acetylglutamate synthase